VKRARELGIAVGTGTPGPLDAITDVAGVRVGSVTLIEGDDVRTGVTVVVPSEADVGAEQRLTVAGAPVGRVIRRATSRTTRSR
jgi:L-aminopeptidase/D-esterase-like protein